MRMKASTDAFQENRLRSVICPFCDQRIKSSKALVMCRNCGEVFERELELPEEEPDENFF